MATVRATMPNKDELLWPGTLVTAEMTLRTEEGVVVPSSAVQVSQTGNFVFVIKDGVAQGPTRHGRTPDRHAKPSSRPASTAAKPS